MVDMPNDTTSLRALIGCCRALIEAATNNRIEEVYRLAEPLCAFAGISRSFVSASPAQDKDGSWCIAAFVRFSLKKHPAPTTARRFDILLFGAMLLMASASRTQRLFFWHVKPDRDRLRFYVRYGVVGGAAGQRVYATRISVVTATDEMRRFAADHHTYRRRELRAKAGSGNVPRGELSREDAIKLAVALYAKNYPDGGLEGVTIDEYEAVLRELLAANDRFEDGWESPM
jgi:hypothetical protein